MLIKDQLPSDEWVEKLYYIFLENQWIDKVGYELVFDAFMERLTKLEEDEINLILQLTNEYLWLDSSEYTAHYIKALKLWISDKCDCKHLIIFPMLTENVKPNALKTKSGIFMLYLFYEASRFISRKDLKIDICETYKSLKECFEENCEIILVDDYIGSGETALEVIRCLHKHVKVDTDRVSAVVLVAQKDGKEQLNKAGYKVYSSLIRYKGISDRFDGKEREDKLELMKKISKRYKKDDYYGYADTEALITLIRTPNNTFPFYWADKAGELAPWGRKSIKWD